MPAGLLKGVREHAGWSAAAQHLFAPQMRNEQRHGFVAPPGNLGKRIVHLFFGDITTREVRPLQRFLTVNSFYLREQNQLSLGNGNLGCASNHLRTFSWHILGKSADRHARNRDVAIRNFSSRIKVSLCNHYVNALIRFEQNAGC
jgi:hypothetical protein